MAKDFQIKATITAEDQASGVVARVERGFASLGTTLKLGLLSGVAAATAGVVGLTRLFGESLSESAKAEEGITRLGNALASLGPRAAGVRDALTAQAEALQKVTKYEDDAIIAGQAFAAGFIKSEEGLKRVTQSAVDLAAGLNIDLQTAFELLTKASQGSTAALGRYGLVLDDSLAPAEKFAALQRIIAERFGGRAAADVNTYAGAMSQLRNAFGDLLERAGDAVTKNEGVIQSLKKLTATLSDAGTIQAVADFATVLVSLSSEVFTGVVEKGREVVDVVRDIGAGFTQSLKDLGLYVPKVVEGAQAFNAITSTAGGLAAISRALTDAILKQTQAVKALTDEEIRAQRIEADSLATKDVLIDAARELGITLESETAAGIAKARIEVEALEDAWRRGVTTADGFRVSAEDVARAHAALADLIAGKATDAVRTHTDAVTDGTTEAGKYATVLRGTLGPALDDIAARADNAARGIQGLVDRSGAAITGVKAIVQGGRVAELYGGGSRLVGTGGTFGSQTRVSDATSKTYIYNPQSGRIEQLG